MLALQDEGETLGALLESLVDAHPESPLVSHLARAFGASEAQAGLPEFVLAPLCTHPLVMDFVGRRGRATLEALQSELSEAATGARPEVYTALAERLVTLELISDSDVSELVSLLAEEGA